MGEEKKEAEEEQGEQHKNVDDDAVECDDEVILRCDKDDEFEGKCENDDRCVSKLGSNCDAINTDDAEDRDNMKEVERRTDEDDNEIEGNGGCTGKGSDE